MGQVIQMETASKYIEPKTEAGMFMGQRYILRFDPNAVDMCKRWVWLVRFTKTFEYYGEAATIEAALKAAKRHIKELVRHE